MNMKRMTKKYSIDSKKIKMKKSIELFVVKTENLKTQNIIHF